MKKNNKSRKGFTIVELVIVIAVIAILAGVLIPTFSGVVTKADESAALQAARNEYTEYMVDHAKDGNDDFIVKGNSKYFVVENGTMKQTAYDTFAAAKNGFTGVTGDAPTYTVSGNEAQSGDVSVITYKAK